MDGWGFKIGNEIKLIYGYKSYNHSQGKERKGVVVSWSAALYILGVGHGGTVANVIMIHTLRRGKYTMLWSTPHNPTLKDQLYYIHHLPLNNNSICWSRNSNPLRLKSYAKTRLKLFSLRTEGFYVEKIFFVDTKDSLLSLLQLAYSSSISSKPVHSYRIRGIFFFFFFFFYYQ